jgi:hypothetical protein
MHKVIPNCPNCSRPMSVTRLQCTSCETVIQAHYEPCRFCRLPEESVRFLGAFVKNRGNLKEMERELGQSYWSLRNRLNELIMELGLEAAPEVEEKANPDLLRKGILEQLKQGEIDATTAAVLLSQLKRTVRPESSEGSDKNG